MPLLLLLLLLLLLGTVVAPVVNIAGVAAISGSSRSQSRKYLMYSDWLIGVTYVEPWMHPDSESFRGGWPWRLKSTTRSEP